MDQKSPANKDASDYTLLSNHEVLVLLKQAINDRDEQKRSLAIKEVYRRFARYAYNAASSRVSQAREERDPAAYSLADPDERKAFCRDLEQNCLLKVVDRIQGYNENLYGGAAWVMTIATNMTSDELGKRRHARPIKPWDEGPEPPFDVQIITAERIACIREAMIRLSPEDRNILELTDHPNNKQRPDQRSADFKSARTRFVSVLEELCPELAQEAKRRRVVRLEEARRHREEKRHTRGEQSHANLTE